MILVMLNSYCHNFVLFVSVIWYYYNAGVCEHWVCVDYENSFIK